MRDSFTHKFILTLVAAASVAALFQFYRHFVVRSIYENSNEGWKEMFHATPASRH